MLIKNQNIKKLEEGKTISISQLPECRHKTRLSNIVEDQNSKIVVVAVLNPNETWQAYAGYPAIDNLLSVAKQTELWTTDWVWNCENINDAQQVKIMGEMLSEEVAKQLFPDWRERKYR